MVFTLWARMASCTESSLESIPELCGADAAVDGALSPDGPELPPNDESYADLGPEEAAETIKGTDAETIEGYIKILRKEHEIFRVACQDSDCENLEKNMKLVPSHINLLLRIQMALPRISGSEQEAMPGEIEMQKERVCAWLSDVFGLMRVFMTNAILAGAAAGVVYRIGVATNSTEHCGWLMKNDAPLCSYNEEQDPPRFMPIHAKAKIIEGQLEFIESCAFDPASPMHYGIPEDHSQLIWADGSIQGKEGQIICVQGVVDRTKCIFAQFPQLCVKRSIGENNVECRE